MEDTDIAQLAGVFDAIGTVTVHVSKNDKYRIGYQYQPVIRIHRPIEDDTLLGKFSAYADEQGVRYHIKEKSNSGEPTSYVFSINDAESIKRFLEPLEPFLVSRLEASLIMTNDIIPAVEDGAHRSREGFLALMDPADELRKKSLHGPEPKYDKAYFTEEWSEATSA